jgi:hypothetical protein
MILPTDRSALIEKACASPDGPTSVGGFVSRSFKTGDVIRLPQYGADGGNIGRSRVYKVVGCYLGADYQEGTYELESLDLKAPDHVIQVPCVMLESHPTIERC